MVLGKLSLHPLSSELQKSCTADNNKFLKVVAESLYKEWLKDHINFWFPCNNCMILIFRGFSETKTGEVNYRSAL